MALTNKQLEEAVKLLRQQAKLQEEVSGSYNGYLEGLKKAKAYNQELNRLRKIDLELQKEIASTTGQAQQDARDKLDVLRKKTKDLRAEYDRLTDALEKTNKSTLMLGKGGAVALKTLGKIPGVFKSIYSSIKGSGLFEMDKATKKAALSMGILSKEGISFTDNLRTASNYTNNLGISLEELSQIQSDFSHELGRSVVLSEASLKSMSEMAAATGLGAEGTAKLASDMTSIGFSAEKTKDFIYGAMNDAHKMGLNASKVVKNIQQNIKLLNKFNFKNGAKGLAKMAESTTKLGVDMEFASGMAEKLFDIEGAVDMSAQLQVMGGEWAKLADPFKLMYMARNDMAGLTEALGEAAKSAVHFNEKTGEFQISALEMHRLRKIAEQTGVAYEDLAQAGRNAAILSKIKSQVNFSVTGDKDLAEYMTNKATFKDGKAEIMVNGKPKLLKALNAADRDILKQQVKEEQNLAERAKQAQTFDESLTNLINMFKVNMLPIVDGINDILKPLVQDIFNNEKFKTQLKELGKDIGEFVKGGAKMVKWLAEMAVTLGPKGTLAVILGAKGIGFLLEKANWFANGIALAEGFNIGTAKGGFIQNLFGMRDNNVMNRAGMTGGQKFGTNFSGGLASKMLKLGGVVTGIIEAGSEFLENKDKGMDTTENAVRSTSKGVGGGLGAWGGAAAGAALGSMILPGIGTIIGGLIGGVGGAYAGGEVGEGAGNLIYGKKANDAILSGGKLTPLDKKDEILAMKPNGSIDKTLKSKAEQPQIIKHVFEDINISGSLMLSFPGGQTQELKLDKDPVFLRNLTRMIHAETERVIKGGKN